jgi:hypothetical protein
MLDSSSTTRMRWEFFSAVSVIAAQCSHSLKVS